MNSTKSRKSYLIIFLSILIFLSFLYSILVILDFILLRYLAQLTQDINKEAQLIENERYLTQDIPMIEEAEKLGFKPILLVPEAFETPPVTKFIEEYKILPLGPRPYTNYYLCNEGYGLPTYKSDRFGFRNNDKIWDKDKIDIMLIGDSFGHGACVEEKDSIAGMLVANSLNVINLSTHGNGAIHYANIATTFTEAIKPKYLVMIIGPNDNNKEKDNIYNKYFPQTGEAYFDNYTPNIRPRKISNELNKLYEEALPFVNDLINQSSIKEFSFFEGNLFLRAYKYLYLPTLNKTFFYLFSHRTLSYSSKLMINTIVSECKKNSCKPVIVYLPTSEFWKPDSRSPTYLKNIKNYILSLSIQPIFIDLTSQINILGLKAHSISGPHLSPLGNQIVIENILKKLNIIN